MILTALGERQGWAWSLFFVVLFLLGGWGGGGGLLLCQLLAAHVVSRKSLMEQMCGWALPLHPCSALRRAEEGGEGLIADLAYFMIVYVPTKRKRYNQHYVYLTIEKCAFTVH